MVRVSTIACNCVPAGTPVLLWSGKPHALGLGLQPNEEVAAPPPGPGPAGFLAAALRDGAALGCGDAEVSPLAADGPANGAPLAGRAALRPAGSVNTVDGRGRKATEAAITARTNTDAPSAMPVRERRNRSGFRLPCVPAATSFPLS